MNGLYSEAAMEADGDTWEPKQEPSHLEVVTSQAVTLSALAALSDMANRVDSMVDAYNAMADAIEEATDELQADATANSIYLSGVPEFWFDHIRFQRTIRKALVQSYRDLANELAATYGTR